MDASVEIKPALLTQEKMRELIKVSQEGDKEARRMMVEGKYAACLVNCPAICFPRRRPGRFVPNWLYWTYEIN